MGYSPWGRKESDTTEQLSTATAQGKSTLNTHWRTEAKAEAPVFWLLDAKSRPTGKVPDDGKD